jgi:hypothetical protein
MDIRKSINSSPAIAIGLALLVVLACGWFLWRDMQPAGPRPATSGFFTVDEGQTWFTDDLNRIAPFDKDGKPAVRVYLFECEGSDKPVVGYLERYTTKGKAAFEKYRAEQKAKPGVMPASLGEFASLGPAAMEVKRPGDAAWTNTAQKEALSITQFACPSGATVRKRP